MKKIWIIFAHALIKDLSQNLERSCREKVRLLLYIDYKYDWSQYLVKDEVLVDR